MQLMVHDPGPVLSTARQHAHTRQKLAAARRGPCVQILNVAALLATQDSKPQMPNVKRRRQEGTDHVRARRRCTGCSSVHRRAR